MAIHKVWVNQNTSIIPDEVLAHRLGLIPIKADPRLFTFKKGKLSLFDLTITADQDDYNEKNSIKFRLHVKCERKPQYRDTKLDAVLDNPDEYLTNTTVYASDLQWVPQGQ